MSEKIPAIRTFTSVLENVSPLPIDMLTDLWPFFNQNVKVNMIADNPPFDEELSEDDRRKRASDQMKFILSECRETEKAIAENDLKELRDGLSDILVTVFGLLHRCFPKDQLFSDHIATRLVDYDPQYAALDAVTAYSHVVAAGWRIEGMIEQPYGYSWDELNNLAWDIIHGVFYTALNLSLPIDLDHAAVTESNLSKFDTSQSDAVLTQTKYTDMGVKTVIVETNYENQTYYVVRSAHDQAVDGKDYPANKFLKSYKFQEPKLVDIGFLASV